MPDDSEKTEVVHATKRCPECFTYVRLEVKKCPECKTRKDDKLDVLYFIFYCFSGICFLHLVGIFKLM